jgi:hypothetical protein
VRGYFSGDIGRLASRVECDWLCPEEAETLADFFVCEIGQPNAERAWVWERQEGFAGLREIGEQLE